MEITDFSGRVHQIAVGNLPPRTAPPIRKRKDMVPEREYGFEKPPAPVLAADIKETIETEVVVVGAGVSGLSAAVSATE